MCLLSLLERSLCVCVCLDESVGRCEVSLLFVAGGVLCGYRVQCTYCLRWRGRCLCVWVRESVWVDVRDSSWPVVYFVDIELNVPTVYAGEVVFFL